MRRLFDGLAWLVALALLCQVLTGCPSFRIDRFNDGADVKPLPPSFAVGRTSLAEVLDAYGAPAEVINMKGHFALHYQRSFYRGGQLSVSIPLHDVIKVSPSFDMSANMQRYDAALFVFTPEGVLLEMAYAKGTAHPWWKTYWK